MFFSGTFYKDNSHIQKMYRLEKSLRESRYKQEKESPSFSSSLLDKIYRSIDDGDKNCEDLKFFRETMTVKKQSKGTSCYTGGKINNRAVEEEGMASFRRACLIEKWMEKKVGEKVGCTQRRKHYSELDTKLDQTSYNDHDPLFFSSTSSSSDSSSGGFSSSDTESMYGARSAVSYSRPKPVQTGLTARPEKTERKQKSSTLFYEQREFHMFDDYHRSSGKEQTPKIHEEFLIKSKSRALKIYSNLKKVKQPISPGGRLASFINSLFTPGNAKKTARNENNDVVCSSEGKSKSVQEPTCSSASSYSRSCLSKNSPSTREKLRNGVKRSVRFYPVSVIVDEDSRPCGHKCLYEEDSALMPVSVPTAWKIGPSAPARKADVMEKTRRVEEAAREFLREYRQNQAKNDTNIVTSRSNNINQHRRNDDAENIEEEEDDAASYSSSDLFELDHLAVIGKERYREELPVYETTRVDRNRAIANGQIM